jgi:septum formation inhibitor MinC
MTSVQNATAKVDSIIADNPGKSLDELVAERKINADQKAQALKKPSLQASLIQLQEQIAQYKKFDQEYQARLNSEKVALQSAHEKEVETVREETRKAAVDEAKREAEQLENDHILLLSKFLRLAAARRQEGQADTDEGRALEGLLLSVYGGDANACTAVHKLVNGVGEKVFSTEHTLVDFTCMSYLICFTISW